MQVCGRLKGWPIAVNLLSMPITWFITCSRLPGSNPRLHIKDLEQKKVWSPLCQTSIYMRRYSVINDYYFVFRQIPFPSEHTISGYGMPSAEKRVTATIAGITRSPSRTKIWQAPDQRLYSLHRNKFRSILALCQWLIDL